MTGRGDEMAVPAGTAAACARRDADREQVIGTLKAAFVHGRLDRGEFDLRVGQAFASRTYAELAAVTASIPAGPNPAEQPEPARAQDQQPVLRPGPVIVVTSLIYAGVWAALILSHLENNDGEALRLVWVTTLTYFMILVISGGHMLDMRREKRSGGQLPMPPGAG